MTKNELFTAIVNGTEITEEMRETAQHALDVDAAAKSRQKEKRANGTATETAAHKANVEMFNTQMYDLLNDEPKTAAALAELLGVKTAKATAVAKVGVELGMAAVTDVKVPNKGTCKGYTRA